jgi:hypothetical protein
MEGSYGTGSGGGGELSAEEKERQRRQAEVRRVVQLRRRQGAYL